MTNFLLNILLMFITLKKKDHLRQVKRAKKLIAI